MKQKSSDVSGSLVHHHLKPFLNKRSQPCGRPREPVNAKIRDVFLLGGPRASTLSKVVSMLLMLPPLLLPAILLLYQNHSVTGSWSSYISDNQSTVSAARQVTSGTMGALQISAVLAIISNFPARTRLGRLIRGIKLDTLGLLNALSVPRMDWTLPKRNWLLVLLTIAMGHAPRGLMGQRYHSKLDSDFYR